MIKNEYSVENMEMFTLAETASLFTRCFSGYPVKVEIDEIKMTDRFKKEGLEKALSFVLNDSYGDTIGICLNSVLKNEARCGGFGIDERYRYKGIGKYFMEEILKNMRRKFVKRYYLEVLEENPEALKLYLKSGFSIFGQIFVLEGVFAQYDTDFIPVPVDVCLDGNSADVVSDVRKAGGYSDGIWTNRLEILLRDEENRVVFFSRNGLVKGYVIFSELGNSEIFIKDVFLNDDCGIYNSEFMSFLKNLFSFKNINYHFISINNVLLKYFVNSHFDLKYPQYLMCREI